MIIFSSYFLSITVILAILGLWFNRRNLIQILISIEIILLMMIINFCSISIIMNYIGGILISFFITIIAATEAALGLIIIVLFFKIKGSILSKNLNLLKN